MKIYKAGKNGFADSLILSDFSCPWTKELQPKTAFCAYVNSDFLFFQFTVESKDPIILTELNHKMEVVHSERVEIFLRSNEEMAPYYCFEIDPTGRVLDYKADFYRKFDYDWCWPESLHVKSKIEPDFYLIEGQFSLEMLHEFHLINDNSLQAGLFRARCISFENKKASFHWNTWIDPQTPKPDFHVREAFGVIKL